MPAEALAASPLPGAVAKVELADLEAKLLLKTGEGGGACAMRVDLTRGWVCPDIDRFQRDKSDPSVIVFSEIKRCQRPHFTQFFQKAKIGASGADAGMSCWSCSCEYSQ